MCLRILLLLLLAAIVHSEIRCKFPNISYSSLTWETHIEKGRYGNLRTVSFDKDLMDQIEYVDGQSKILHRKCTALLGENTYLVEERAEEENATILRCIEFIVHHPSVMQLSLSGSVVEINGEVDCRPMTLDPWILIATAYHTEPCDIDGGYDVTIMDNNDTVICKSAHLENNCIGERNIIFDLPQECPTDVMLMRPAQELYCIAQWTQNAYTFTVMSDQELYAKVWLLRRHAVNTANVILFNDLVADTNPRIIATTNYYLVRMVRPPPCADCSTCQFDPTFQGSWQQLGTNSSLVISGQTLYWDDEVKEYECVSKEFAVQTNIRQRHTLLLKSNKGCFRRHACAELRHISPSVLEFRLSGFVRHKVDAENLCALVPDLFMFTYLLFNDNPFTLDCPLPSAVDLYSADTAHCSGKLTNCGLFMTLNANATCPLPDNVAFQCVAAVAEQGNIWIVTRMENSVQCWIVPQELGQSFNPLELS